MYIYDRCDPSTNDNFCGTKTTYIMHKDHDYSYVLSTTTLFT